MKKSIRSDPHRTFLFNYIYSILVHLSHAARVKLIHFASLTRTMYNLHSESIQVSFNRYFIGEKCCLLWDSNPRPSDLISSGAGCKSPCGIFTSLWLLTFFPLNKVCRRPKSTRMLGKQLFPRCWRWRDYYPTSNRQGVLPTYKTVLNRKKYSTTLKKLSRSVRSK